MKAALVAVVLSTFLTSLATAQSLDPDKPYPLKAGANRGTVDNTVGPNYFYFWAGAGQNTVHVTYNSMTFLGAGMQSSLTVQLSDEKKSWKVRKVVTSLNKPGEATFPGDLKERTKIIVSLFPPSGGLIRTGGDYEVEVTGAAQFDPEPAAVDLLVGMYTPKTIYENENTAVKFSADGTLEFASGTQGRWKLFDVKGRIFTVSFGTTRLSLKLLPGRGLVQPNDASIVFQQTP